MDYQEMAKLVVFEYIRSQFDKSELHPTFAIDEVFIVWFCKTLQNWKALVTTTLPNKVYYELTYNGDADELYIDVYKKLSNKSISKFSEIAKTAV